MSDRDVPDGATAYSAEAGCRSLGRYSQNIEVVQSKNGLDSVLAKLLLDVLGRCKIRTSSVARFCRSVPMMSTSTAAG